MRHDDRAEHRAYRQGGLQQAQPLRPGVQDGSFIAEALVKNGFRLKMLREEEIDLEDVFMGITKGITN